jgi:hypothetical protein
MRLIEQHRHFSQHRARLGDDGNDGVALDDLKPSLDQDIEVTGCLSFVDDQPAGSYALLNSILAIVQNRAHPATSPTSLIAKKA